MTGYQLAGMETGNLTGCLASLKATGWRRADDWLPQSQQTSCEESISCITALTEAELNSAIHTLSAELPVMTAASHTAPTNTPKYCKFQYLLDAFGLVCRLCGVNES